MFTVKFWSIFEPRMAGGSFGAVYTKKPKMRVLLNFGHVPLRGYLGREMERRSFGDRGPKRLYFPSKRKEKEDPPHPPLPEVFRGDRLLIQFLYFKKLN